MRAFLYPRSAEFLKFMRKGTKWFSYVVFVGFVGLVSLYISFPSDAARKYLEGLAEHLAPQLVMKVEHIRPALPFGLKADQTSFAYRDKPRIFLVKADSFVVMPKVWTFFLRKPAFRFDCQAYGGRIKGRIGSSNLNFEGPYSSYVKVFHVDLDKCSAFKETLKRDFSGTLDGEVTFQWVPDGFLQGSGEGVFSVANGRVLFAQPFMDLDSLDFRRIDIRMVLRDKQVLLDRFDFKGDQMEGTASGTVFLDPVFERSTLDLRVSVKPSSEFLIEKRELFDAARFLANRLNEDRFTLNVRGTIGQPRANFM